MKPPVIVKASASPLDAVYTASFFLRRDFMVVTATWVAGSAAVVVYVERRIRREGKNG